MIVSNKISLYKLYYYTKKKFWFLMLTTGLSVAAFYFLQTDFKGLSYPAGFMGTALAFLIGFRNNAAYDRWWEARKIWGKLINDSRHFSLKVEGFVSDFWNPTIQKTQLMEAKKDVIYRHIGFVWALNKHLRKLPWEAHVAPFLSQQELENLKTQEHIPLTILKNQVLHIKKLYETRHIEDFRHMQFDTIMENFNDAIGKCERIKNTTFPKQYNWFMHYAIRVFLFILPFSLIGYLEYWSVPFSLSIGYVFIMLEYVGKYIENPFENTINDTPIDALSRTIEINLRENLGEKHLPEKIKPVKGKYLF